MAARKKMYKPTGKRRKKSKSAGMKKGSCKRVKTKGLFQEVWDKKA